MYSVYEQTNPHDARRFVEAPHVDVITHDEPRTHRFWSQYTMPSFKSGVITARTAGYDVAATQYCVLPYYAEYIVGGEFGG